MLVNSVVDGMHADLECSQVLRDNLQYTCVVRGRTSRLVIYSYFVGMLGSCLVKGRTVSK